MTSKEHVVMQRWEIENGQALFLAAACGLAFLLASARAAAESPVVSADTYQVGAAKIDVTPEEPIRLSGFGFRREESQGIESRIHARALAISDASGVPAILLTVDSTGISDAIVEEVAKRLQPEGVTRERLVITATHTHTAPMLDGVLETLFGEPLPADHQEAITRYTQTLTHRLVEVSRAALADLQPAELWWGIGQLEFAMNRRNSETGPVDHNLPVLAVKTPTGELRAVLTTYACHAVTLSHNQVGGDWPGKAAAGIERRHPNAIALISIGCGADQNPLSGVTGDQVDVAMKQGLQMADEVDRVLRNALRPLSGKLTGHLERFPLALAPLPERAHWEQLAQQDSYIGYHAQVQLASLDRGEPLPEAIDYSVQTWTFGDSLAMVFLPGEVVVDYALRLRDELDRARLWITAYANDTPCYIPSERVLREGGYEGGSAMTYYNLPAKLAPGLEAKIVEAATSPLLPTFAPPHPQADQAGLPPLSPAQTLNRLHLPADWEAQTVAAEPLTTDPVAFDFAPDGSLWVCEMHDYPSGLAGHFEPGGKIRLLRDRDGDGVYDRSTVFLDGLPFPTGVMVWRKGVLICAAPNILYAEDTDGDDQADVQRVLFSGFGTDNYQARVNSLTPGLDGWVYGACGLFGGEIHCHQTGQRVALGNRDFRIDPDRGILEPLTGRTQQGRVRNDAGDWFGCTNGQACLHYPILQAATRPGLSLPPLIDSVPNGNASQLFPAAADYQRFKLSGPAGQVTAACGLGIYRDDWLGQEMAGNAVVCEPVNLLLHRRLLQRHGTTYVGLRAPGEETSELVASTDNWFRPAQVRTGPDGGLWIADMTRSVIEHPRWIPEATLAKLDVRAGDRQGRIIRILPRQQGARAIPNLAGQSPVTWVASLRSPNGIVRDLAQQLLFWNPDPATISPLRELVHSDAAAAGRAAALWILTRARGLQADDLRVTLSAEDPLLRRQAVRVVAEAGDQLENRGELLRALRGETDPAVAAELANTLWHIDADAGLSMLTDLYTRHPDDSYLRFCVLRAVPAAQWADFVAQVIPQTEPAVAKLEPLLSISLAEQDGAALQTLVERIASQPADPAALRLSEPIAQAFWKQRKSTSPWWHEDTRATIRRLQQQARESFSDDGAPLAQRIAAAGLLGWEASQRSADFARLAAALDPQSPPALQQQVIAVLARTGQSEVTKLFLTRLDGLGSTASGQIVKWLMSRPETVKRLLTAIEQQEVPAATLTATDRQTLLSFPDEELRATATRLLTRPSDRSRGEVVDRYRQVLQMTGDPQRGHKIFQQHCRTCHRVGEEGFEVGPALSESRNKPWAALLNAVFDPNQAVDQRYGVYVVATLDGRVAQGLLAQEGESSITLKGPDAKATVIARDEIDLFKQSTRSLMPEGLEESVTPQEVADLFAFITERTTAPDREVDPLAERAAQLLDDSQPVGYLGEAENPELQMGAVSGLVDVPDPLATAALIDALPQLTERNRQLALDGLLRSADRRRALLQSVIAGDTPADLIGAEYRKRLQESEASALRELASRAFGKP